MNAVPLSPGRGERAANPPPSVAARRRRRVVVAASAVDEASARIAAAWRELGLPAEVVAPIELRDEVLAGDVVVGRLDVLPTLDGVEPGLFELLRVERRGARVLNPASALLAAHDKLRTARVLERAGLPHPRTAHVTRGRDLRRYPLPLVVKPRFGSWGADVIRCRTEGELADCLDYIPTRSWFQRHGALVQELITPRGYDLRILVAGGRAVGGIERIAAPHEWRTNISLGGSLRPRTPSAEAATIATAAAAAIGGDLVGVDLLPVDGGYTIIELNGAVDFDGDYSLRGRDVYADISAALELTHPAAMKAT